MRSVIGLLLTSLAYAQVPSNIASENSEGLPFMKGTNHVRRSKRGPAMEAVSLFASVYTPFRNTLETPIAMRAQFYYWVVQWNVVAATKKDSNMLNRLPDPTTNEYSVPAFKLTASQIDTLYAGGYDAVEEFRAKALLVAFYRWSQVSLTKWFPVGDPRQMEMNMFWEELKLQGTQRTQPAFQAQGWDQADSIVIDVTSTHDDYHSVGNGIGDFLDGYVCDDGWNECGTDRHMGQHSLAPFADTTGFFPQHQANVGGDPRRWAPLTECKSGFCFKQDHVVPHIGFTARSYFLNASDRANILEQVQRPEEFDYDAEMRQVLTEMEGVAMDAEYKTLITHYDNKFAYAVQTAAWVLNQNELKFEDWVFYATGFLTVEYEGAVINWASKIDNDHVRPTTVAQELLGEEVIESWGYDTDEKVSIPANQWTPYIRVMPHGEFPSGSACLCTAASSFTAAVLEVGHDEPYNIEYTFKAHSNTVEPRLPAEPFTRSWSSWKATADECAETRYRGGMHFSNSLDPGAAMCSTMNDFTGKALAFTKWQWTGNEDFLLPYGGLSAFGGNGDRNYEYGVALQSDCLHGWWSQNRQKCKQAKKRGQYCNVVQVCKSTDACVNNKCEAVCA